jgi:hypothetical protein
MKTTKITIAGAMNTHPARRSSTTIGFRFRFD